MRGAAFMVLSALGFSLMTATVKLLGGRLPTLEIVFVRGVITGVLTWLLLWREGVSPRGNRRQALLVRGVVGVVALSLLYAATTRLPLAEVTVLHFTNPLFTALLAALWLHEHAGARLVAGLAVGLAGVLTLAAPALGDGGGRLSAEDLPAMGLALLSAMLAAVAYVAVRDLRRSEHPLVVVLWFALVMIPFSAVPAIAGWVAPTPFEWGILLLVALSALVGQVYLTRGLAELPAGRAMAIGYVQVGFAALWGIVFFHDVPGAATLLGVALIIAGALLANAGAAARGRAGA